MERLGHSKFRLRRATNASEQGQMSITAIRFQSEAVDRALRPNGAVRTDWRMCRLLISSAPCRGGAYHNELPSFFAFVLVRAGSSYPLRRLWYISAVRPQPTTTAKLIATPRIMLP